MQSVECDHDEGAGNDPSSFSSKRSIAPSMLDKMFSLFGIPRYSTFVSRLCGPLPDISVKSASWSNCLDPHETHQISYSQPWKDLAADFIGPLRSSKYVFLL